MNTLIGIGVGVDVGSLTLGVNLDGGPPYSTTLVSIGKDEC